MSKFMRPLVAGLFAMAVLVSATAGALAGDLEITGAWARATPPGVKNGAGYMTIENHGAADKLLGASGTAADRVELHEHTMVGDIMRMHQVPFVDVPAGGKVAFKPGGYHVMFIGLKGPLKEGSMVMVTLKFEKAGEVMVHMPVRKGAPGGMPGMNHGNMKHDHKTPAN